MQVKPLKIISLLIAPLLLAACTKQEYPLSVKNDLLSMCMEGIMSGQTPVLDKEHQQENVSKNIALCEFRLANFINDVDYEDYQRYQLNLYQSFERAYRQKYVLSDVYNNLSDNDQKVFASISRVMLGLGEKNE
ncbi:MAG: hypothetical protein GX860_05885 [Alcaligenaceae bacterium]|jgi:hypothetical protein|nr:hypothetical protein [Alcaligenaceae bacterium]